LEEKKGRKEEVLRGRGEKEGGGGDHWGRPKQVGCGVGWRGGGLWDYLTGEKKERERVLHARKGGGLFLSIERGRRQIFPQRKGTEKVRFPWGGGAL